MDDIAFLFQNFFLCRNHLSYLDLDAGNVRFEPVCERQSMVFGQLIEGHEGQSRLENSIEGMWMVAFCAELALLFVVKAAGGSGFFYWANG